MISQSGQNRADLEQVRNTTHSSWQEDKSTTWPASSRPRDPIRDPQRQLKLHIEQHRQPRLARFPEKIVENRRKSRKSPTEHPGRPIATFPNPQLRLGALVVVPGFRDG